MKPLEHRYKLKRKRKPYEPLPGVKPAAGDHPAAPTDKPAGIAARLTHKPGLGPIKKSASAPVSSAPSLEHTHWGDVAAWYDNLVGDQGSDYHQNVVLPGVVRLLPLGPADFALDVACGQGVLCRQMKAKGARVTGVDAAAPLIKLAQERSDPSIDFQVMDARELNRLPENRYTAATCILAIQNIDPIAPVFEGVARALRQGGRFLLVMMHPCFRQPKQAHWAWADKERTQYRRVDRYMLPYKEAIAIHPGSAPTQPSQQIWAFHRPLQTYISALGKAGLLVDRMEEWTSHKRSDPGPKAEAEDRARKEIPLFLALRMVKTGG